MKPARRIYDVLTLFGLGYVRFSASIASAIAIVLYALLRRFPGGEVATWLLLCAATVALLIGARAREAYLDTDPREAVIDEFLGMLVCALVFNGTQIVVLVLLFILFRVLDILKPFPFSWIDSNVRGRFGFVIDDVAIGIALGIAARCAMLLFH